MNISHIMKNACFFVVLLSLSTYGQNKANTNDRLQIEVMLNKIENLENQFQELKQHNKEMQEAHRQEVDKLMQQKEDALDSRMLIYVSFFVTAFILLIGLFRWLGKGEIRNIVYQQAVKQI